MSILREPILRILLLAQFYPPIFGGEEHHVHSLAVALVKRGHDVAVATQWIPDAKSFEVDGQVRIHRIRGSLQRVEHLFTEGQRRHAPPIPDPELVLGLRRVVDAEKPDVVHGHNWMYMSYLPLKKRLGIPLVVTLHDYSLICAKKNFMRDGAVCSGRNYFRCISCAQQHFGSAKGVMTSLGLYQFSWLARGYVDKFITVSKAVAQYNDLDRFRLAYEVIPNFVPDDVGTLTQTGHEQLLAQLPDRFILFVGDLMRLKGIEVLFEAYSRLNAPPPLVLIGRQYPETPPLPPNVIHLGRWPREAVMHAWDKCLFGVLPSIGLETFGIVILEAMSRGKPFIASRIGGMSDVVVDNATGFLVPPGDASELAMAMQTLVDHPEIINHMSIAAVNRLEMFTAHAVVPRIEAVYESVAR